MQSPRLELCSWGIPPLCPVADAGGPQAPEVPVGLQPRSLCSDGVPFP